MVTLKKKQIGGRTYYYLGHTYRERGKVKYKEVYVGDKLPKDIERIRKEFLQRIYKERWFGLLEKIKSGYSKELKRTPHSVKEGNLEAFMVAFTYDTNRIEGSRLSFKDTAMLLEHNTTPKGKPIEDIKETESHKKVFYDMLECKKTLSIDIILKWHAALFKDTKPEIAGIVRDYQVYITGTRFVPPTPTDVHKLMSEFIDWYGKEKDRMNPVELAATAHVKFEGIHPFGDGNGRIGRLIVNFILHGNGYPMLNISYLDRTSYYNSLERAQVKGDYSVFVLWFFRRYVKEYKRYLP